MTVRPVRPRRPLPAAALVAALALLLVAPGAADAAEHRFGIGVHYWRTVDSIDDLNDIADDGYSYVASYQYKPAGLFRFELDLELFDDGFGGSTETAYAPQAFVLIGGGLYGGVGIGATYSDGLDSDFSDPFYMVRLGWDLSLLGALHVDIGAIYRFDDWEEVEEFDIGDTFTLGVTARIGF